MPRIKPHQIIAVIAYMLIGVFIINYVRVQYHLATIYSPQEPEPFDRFPTQRMWIYNGETQIECPVITLDKVIYIRTKEYLTAISAIDGSLIGEVEPLITKYVVGCPYGGEDVILNPELEGGLSAYSATTGTLLWRDPFERPDPVRYEVSAFAVGQGVAITSRPGAYIIAYDLHRGNTLWEKKLPISGNPSGPIVVENGVVYMGIIKSLYAYDLRNGKELWNLRFDGDVFDVLYDADRLYLRIGYDSPKVLAVDINSRQITWQVSFSGFASGNSLLLYKGNFLLAGTRLIKFSPQNGNIVWKSEGTLELKQPVVYDDKIYVRDIENKVLAFDEGTGEILGYLLVQPSAQNPIISNDLLIVPFGDGRIFAYKP